MYLALHTVSNKSYGRENIRGFREFLMDCKSFPMNALSKGNSLNTDEAKINKVFPTFG